jgi:hypothetical protein
MDAIQCRDHLETIMRSCEGAVAGALMGRNRETVFCIAQDQQLPIEDLSKDFSEVLSQVRDTAEILKIGATQDVTIYSASFTYIFQAVDQQHFVGLVLQPEAACGKGKHVLRMAVPDLRARL